MKVEFLGHAGIQLASGETRFVIDAWLSAEGAFDASWYQFPANHHLAKRDWSHLAAAIVSHEHLDHVDPEFLARLPERVPIYIPQYPSANTLRVVEGLSGRRPKVMRVGTDHRLGDFEMRIWTEASPMNQDSAWAIRAPGGTLVHTVDSRLTQEQNDEVLEWLGGPPDVLLVQCSGASWYPLMYENYDAERRRQLSEQKRRHKLAYVLSVARKFQPRILVTDAGPPVFLDDELRFANDDPIFPSPAEARDWLTENGYSGRILTPMPGDVLDIETGELTEDEAVHADCNWERTDAYLDRYAERVRPHIERVRQRADAIQVDDLYGAFEQHFRRMLGLNEYFNQRIDMTVCFDIEGPQGGQWLVDFRDQPDVRPYCDGDTYQYRYRFHERWLKRVLVDGVPWEDFFLSCRFRAWRDPDVYNDHLLGLLKFDDDTALKAVENYEKITTDETIIVTAPDGARYEIAKYCPHAGASLEGAPIEGHRITCLNHHYVFDLDTGACLTGNCTLRTRRCQ